MCRHYEGRCCAASGWRICNLGFLTGSLIRRDVFVCIPSQLIPLRALGCLSVMGQDLCCAVG